ncbi:hypothetical protein P171DRAFT_525126 [Karstenula rhodostoma CBS 690.94]|uniref:Uncharacterized protein n=1 Tax=Karstenula rhodostoma CBS 690.94 TaxID=1392251 RepID=A0A9P4U7F9_9PLEO|nr:hypothetical protein P171DRAFT_525126 [Karstenula rhodostoma CBS 690.94]
MQTVPAAVLGFIRDFKSTIKHAETITLREQDADENSDLEHIKTKALVVKQPEMDFEIGIRHTEIVVQQGYIRALGSSVRNKSLRTGDFVLLSFATCAPYKTSHPACCTTHANVNQNGGRIAKMSVVNEMIISVIENTVEFLAPLGTAGIVGFPPTGKIISLDPISFLLKNKRRSGAIEAESDPRELIPRSVKLQRQGHFQSRGYVGRTRLRKYGMQYMTCMLARRCHSQLRSVQMMKSLLMPCSENSHGKWKPQPKQLKPKYAYP